MVVLGQMIRVWSIVITCVPYLTVPEPEDNGIVADGAIKRELSTEKVCPLYTNGVGAVVGGIVILLSGAMS